MITYFMLSLGPVLLAWSLCALAGTSPEIASAIGIAAALLFVTVGELIVTRDEAFEAADVIHALLSAGTSQLCIVAAIWLMGMRSTASSWPLVAQVLLIVVGSDFAGYWAHRAQHRVELLWRGHAIHHMPQQLYWLNGLRAHPTDAAWVFLVATLWALAAGFSPLALALSGVVITSHLLIQHTRLRIPRSLEVALVTPSWHAVHHDRAREDGVNLAKVFTIWDRMFGTFRPSDPPPAALGINDPIGPSVVDSLLYPFSRAR